MHTSNYNQTLNNTHNYRVNPGKHLRQETGLIHLCFFFCFVLFFTLICLFKFHHIMGILGSIPSFTSTLTPVHLASVSFTSFFPLSLSSDTCGFLWIEHCCISTQLNKIYHAIKMKYITFHMSYL